MQTIYFFINLSKAPLILLELIQEDITAIRNWMSCNFLTLNASKCKYMLVSQSRIHQYPQLYLADQPLECVQSYKYLGVTITSTLSWSDHIQSICNKSRRLVGLLYRQFYPNADTDTLRQFYLSCIRPHLEYARVQFGIPTLQKKDLFWRMCKSLPARSAVNYSGDRTFCCGQCMQRERKQLLLITSYIIRRTAQSPYICND